MVASLLLRTLRRFAEEVVPEFKLVVACALDLRCARGRGQFMYKASNDGRIRTPNLLPSGRKLSWFVRNTTKRR